MQPFVPFPPGTIRGPFYCGGPDGHDTSVQYCVQTQDGWVYYIRRRKYEAEAKQLAQTKSAAILAHEPQPN